MGVAGNFNPEWGYVAPTPASCARSASCLSATPVGAAVGGGVVVSLVDRTRTLLAKTRSRRARWRVRARSYRHLPAYLRRRGPRRYPRPPTASHREELIPVSFSPVLARQRSRLLAQRLWPKFRPRRLWRQQRRPMQRSLLPLRH